MSLFICLFIDFLDYLFPMPIFIKKTTIISFKLILTTLLFFALTQCGIYRKTDARKVSVNANERVQKNLEEGRRITFGGGGSRSGEFDFATSNEMWRATLDILDFIPINNADYGGGIIVTDWYSETGSENDSIKIMVQFLSNEIRADGLKVIVYKRSCKISNGTTNCSTNSEESIISQEIKLAILKQASKIKNETTDKNVKEFRKKRPQGLMDRDGKD